MRPLICVAQRGPLFQIGDELVCLAERVVPVRGVFEQVQARVAWSQMIVIGAVAVIDLLKPILIRQGAPRYLQGS